ncbi:MAG: tetratricopeptide repeat protein, partial [Thermoanaerobaculia bacterium]
SVLGDPHLASCEMCSDALDSYRDIAGLLCDKDIWDEDESFDLAPPPESLSRIRAFADSVAREDAEAEEMVNELLEMPTEWWAEEVRSDERYATAGAVRRIIAVANAATFSAPKQADELTAIAVELVERLSAASSGEEALELLRGRAWRERGNVLEYLGRIDTATIALSKAADAFERCSLADVDLARTRLLMSIIQWRSEDYDTALKSARGAEEVFAAYGVGERVRAARWMETNILASSGRYREAIDRFRRLESEAASKPSDVATIIMNMAYCYRELGEYDRALPQYQFALGIFEEVGNEPEAARVRWNIAGVLAQTGNIVEAEKRYRTVRAEFQSHGMLRDVAVLDLSLAEIALAQGRFEEAEPLCRNVIAFFESITAPYSSKALAALSYLREAVEQRKASATVAEAVRRYVSRLPQQPNLLFAPPPLP